MLGLHHQNVSKDAVHEKMPYGILIFRAKIFAVFSEKFFAKNKELNMKRLQTAIVLGVVALFAMTSSFSAPKQKTIKLGFNNGRSI